MSIAAVSTVLDARVAPDSPSVWRLLVTLADYADPDGRHAFPTVGTLADRTGFARSTVHLALRELEARQLIRRGDQQLVEHRPANRRPTVYDLDLPAIRGTRLGSDDPPEEILGPDDRTPGTLGLGSDRGPTGVRQGSDGERGLGSDSSDTNQVLNRENKRARASSPADPVDDDRERTIGRCADCGQLVTPTADRAGTLQHADPAGRSCPGTARAPTIVSPGDYTAGAQQARTALERTRQ